MDCIEYESLRVRDNTRLTKMNLLNSCPAHDNDSCHLTSMIHGVRWTYDGLLVALYTLGILLMSSLYRIDDWLTL